MHVQYHLSVIFWGQAGFESNDLAYLAEFDAAVGVSTPKATVLSSFLTELMYHRHNYMHNEPKNVF